MEDKKKALRIISERLKDIPWAIFSGTGRDIDVIVPGDKEEGETLGN